MPNHSKIQTKKALRGWWAKPPKIHNAILTVCVVLKQLSSEAHELGCSPPNLPYRFNLMCPINWPCHLQSCWYSECYPDRICYPARANEHWIHTQRQRKKLQKRLLLHFQTDLHWHSPFNSLFSVISSFICCTISSGVYVLRVGAAPPSVPFSILLLGCSPFSAGRLCTLLDISEATTTRSVKRKLSFLATQQLGKKIQWHFYCLQTGCASSHSMQGPPDPSDPTTPKHPQVFTSH